jgi:hypothetical protein
MTRLSDPSSLSTCLGPRLVGWSDLKGWSGAESDEARPYRQIVLKHGPKEFMRG